MRLRVLLTRLIKWFLFHLGIFSLIRRYCPNQEVAVLRYHSIGRDSGHWIDTSIAISENAFELHVRYLAQRYRVISMDELVKTIQNGRPLPCNSLVFTFDDGYVDNYVAAKVLKRHGISGTFYITAGCIESDEPLWMFEVRTLVLQTDQVNVKLRIKGTDLNIPLKNDTEKRDAVRQITRWVKSHDIETRGDILNQVRSQLGTRGLQEAAQQIMLTWAQLKEMVADGMTVGGHTMTHCNLPHAKPAEAAFEVRECKAVLEAHLEITVGHFAYPNGGASTYYNEEIKALLVTSGYLSATTSLSGFVGLNSDLFELRRIRTTEPLHEIVYELEGERFLKRRYAGT